MEPRGRDARPDSLLPEAGFSRPFGLVSGCFHPLCGGVDPARGGLRPLGGTLGTGRRLIDSPFLMMRAAQATEEQDS
jgi:hypothetical protein